MRERENPSSRGNSMVLSLSLSCQQDLNIDINYDIPGTLSSRRADRPFKNRAN